MTLHTDDTGAPSGAPNPLNQSCIQAADEFLHAMRRPLADHIYAQRVQAGIHTHEPFVGILKEHALKLDEIRDVLLEALARDGDLRIIRKAINHLRGETRYVRELAGEEVKRA